MERKFQVKGGVCLREGASEEMRLKLHFPKREVDLFEKGWRACVEKALSEGARACLCSQQEACSELELCGRRGRSWAYAPEDWRARLQTPVAPLPTKLSWAKRKNFSKLLLYRPMVL